jgi:hypothetical protein
VLHCHFGGDRAWSKDVVGSSLDLAWDAPGRNFDEYKTLPRTQPIASKLPNVDRTSGVLDLLQRVAIVCPV